MTGRTADDTAAVRGNTSSLVPVHRFRLAGLHLRQSVRLGARARRSYTRASDPRTLTGRRGYGEVVLSAHAFSPASPAAAWELLAEPQRWSSWAPHIRGAIGLGSPEVEAGRGGLAFVGLAVPVPVRITAKSPGRSWEWVTGPVRVHHSVEPRPDGCVVSVQLSAPWPIEVALRLTYQPLLGPLMRNLARVAARST